MLLKASMKLYFLLSIITIFALNSVYAKKPKKSKENNDSFYMVLTENSSGDGKTKREEKEQFLDALVTEINSLIIGNKDTYDDPSILKKLEEAPAPVTPFTKRSDVKDKKEDNDDEEDDDGDVEAEDHKFAYVISSLDDESIISSYLSEELVPLVKEMPSVKAVIPDFKLEYFSRKKDLEEIKKTNKWEHSCLRKNAYNHLSLISQNKFDDSNNSTIYDESYYYPSSAGEGINIFILDSGFNFRHDDFSNRITKENKKNERIATCFGSAGSNRSYLDLTDQCTDFSDDGHGNAVANVAAGLTNGVASKANVYGFTVVDTFFDDRYTLATTLLQGLEHINSRYLNEKNPENVDKFIHKSIINMSCGYYFTEEQRVTLEGKKKFTEYFGELIKRMSNKGAVFVAAAGNDSVLSDEYVYPCSFDDVICVGATDNIAINDDYYTREEIKKNKYNEALYPDLEEWEEKYDEADIRYTNNYRNFFKNKFVLSKSYRRAFFSNFGKKVDIYAPGYAKIFYRVDGEVVLEKNMSGTSFSSPIVAGVAATIMSEKPYMKYTTSLMKKELQEMGLKGIIQDIDKDQPNIFVNNGNLLGYNYDGEEDDDDTNDLECFYHGCCLRN